MYAAYLVLSFLTGCIGSVYGLAYKCLYPDLIPKGMAQKGYAVSSLVYPLVNTIVTPIAAIVYKSFGVEILFIVEGTMLIIAATFEAVITYDWVPPKKLCDSRGVKGYFGEIADGIRYLKKEKGIRKIYMYMAVTNATETGNHLMVMAHFQTSSVLTTTMFSLLMSAETLGRMLGAALHYFFKIPEDKRYALTVRVYAIYEICDGALLFLWYPLMVVLRFVCGFLGVNTATLREAAVQNYLPADKRARVNGLFSVIISVSLLVAQLAAGALGEIIQYRLVMLGSCVITFVVMVVLIVFGKKDVEPIYNRKV